MKINLTNYSSDGLIGSGDILVIGQCNNEIKRTVLYKEDVYTDKIILVDLERNWFFCDYTLEIALSRIQGELLGFISSTELELRRNL